MSDTKKSGSSSGTKSSRSGAESVVKVSTSIATAPLSILGGLLGAFVPSGSKK